MSRKSLGIMNIAKNTINFKKMSTKVKHNRLNFKNGKNRKKN